MKPIFDPAYQGQNLHDYLQGNDHLVTATDPILDGQGRMRRASAATGDPILSDYDRASIERSNRAGTGDFNAVRRSSNNSTGSGRGMTYAQARKLGANSHRAARRMIARSEMGINPASNRSYDLEANDRRRGELLEQEIESRPVFNDLAIQEREQRIEHNDFNFEQAQAAKEAAAQAAIDQQILDQTVGEQRNDVLLDQNPGYGTVTKLDPALDAAMAHNAAGRIDLADEFLDMRPAPEPEAPRVVDLGDGTKIIQQGNKYLGTAPRPQGDAAPTTQTRNNHAFMEALEQGNYAMAALYMDSIEEPAKDRFGTPTRRQATAADAQRYHQQMNGQPPAAPAPAAPVSTADVMELFKSTK